MSEVEQAKQWAPRPVYHPTPLQCPSCNGLLERFSEHSQLMVCGYCNERLELTPAEAIALGKAEQVEFDQFTLDVGQKFVWEDIEYTLIGRVSFLDSEGDPAQKDYLLFHPQFGTLWATEYWGYGYYVTKRSRLLPPKAAFTGTGTITMADGSRWKFSERETYTIEQVDGALPYIAQVGDQVDIVELRNTKQFRKTMAIERTKGSEEIECSISQQITEKEWKVASGLYTEADANREARRHMPWWGRLIGFVASVLTIWSLVTASMNQDYGEELVSFIYSRDDLRVEHVTDTFTLTDLSEPIGFHFQSSVDNEWIAIQYAILQSPIEGDAMTYEELVLKEQALEDGQQSTVLLVSDVGISYFHGYEGGESWSEGSIKASERWMFPPDVKGPFRILLSVPDGEANNPTVSVSVVQRDETAGKYFGAIFVSVLMSLFFILKWR